MNRVSHGSLHSILWTRDKRSHKTPISRNRMLGRILLGVKAVEIAKAHGASWLFLRSLKHTQWCFISTVSKVLRQEFVLRNMDVLCWVFLGRETRRNWSNINERILIRISSLPMHEVKWLNFSLKYPILTQPKPPKSQRGCYGTFKHKSQFLEGNIILLLINRRIILDVYIAPFFWRTLQTLVH